MRLWAACGLVALCTVASAPPVFAASLGFTGTLSIQIGVLDPITIEGAGVAIVNGSGAGGHIEQLTVPASAFATDGLRVAVTDPAAFPIAGLQLTAHDGNGFFQEVGSNDDLLYGGLPLLGAAKVCLYGTCGASNDIANLNVPLSVVGVGGAVTAMGPVSVTVIGAPWTTGTAFVGNVLTGSTASGGRSPQSNTAIASGIVTLVTPVFISTSIPAQARVDSFAFLTLHFVPEPGTLVLLGSGVAALVVGGRGRRA